MYTWKSFTYVHIVVLYILVYTWIKIVLFLQLYMGNEWKESTYYNQIEIESLKYSIYYLYLYSNINVSNYVLLTTY